MALSPLAMSLLGIESPPQRPRAPVSADPNAVVPEEVVDMPELRPINRPPRCRPTSYFNSFQTSCAVAKDDPPSYERAVRTPAPRRPANDGSGRLPAYSCTVSMTAKVLLQLESISPLHEPTGSDWREVQVVLTGTLLSFHRAKESGPGKLFRSYTLQHAEIGLATDIQHTVLVPRSKIARLIPTSARKKAWEKDPQLFTPVRQHLLRLRAETDQIVLATADEDELHTLIHSISAGIDIAHAIDERSIPRQCTVPRRRRRPRASQTDDINDPTLVAEQERILREMYPEFAEQTRQARPGLERTVTASSAVAQTPAREEEEVDLAAMREDMGGSDEPARRPPMTRNTTSSSVQTTYSNDMFYATTADNFTEDGKWQPPHTRTAQQIQRYIRRCMPVLNIDAIRASDVLISHGKRVKINWRMELLEEWTLQPPSYKSHHFENDLGLERTTSQHSATGSVTQDSPHNSTSDLGREGDDQITPADAGLITPLEMAKTAVMGSMGKRDPSPPRSQQQPARHPVQDIQGVVFCF